MLGSASFVIFFYLKERSQFLVGVGVAIGARFGTFFLTLSRMVGFPLLTFLWLHQVGFLVGFFLLASMSRSVSCLDGLLNLSTVSTRDLFLVRSLGLVLASISQAAVGIVRIAPQMSLRAWFCTLSKDRTAPLLAIVWRGRL